MQIALSKMQRGRAGKEGNEQEKDAGEKLSQWEIFLRRTSHS